MSEEITIPHVVSHQELKEMPTIVTIWCMVGCPGSGKSYLAQKLKENFLRTYPKYDSHGKAETLLATSIFSTDDYWIRPDGYYDWNYKRIKEAHEWNQKRAVDFIEQNHKLRLIRYINPIIDNTNLDFKAIKPYCDIAIKYKGSVQLCEPNTYWRYNLDELEKRNTHDVPRDTLENMLKKKVPIEDLQKQVNDYMVNNASQHQS